MTEHYWQAIKDYKWRILRLSTLLTVLTILVMSSFPPVYVGTAKLTLSPPEPSLIDAAFLPPTDTVEQKELAGIFEEMLLANIANSVQGKLKKFRLTDVDSELEKALSGYEFITPIKQKVRTVLPFMPQQDPAPLSPRQLRTLRNNYTSEQIMQNLQLRYSMDQNKIYIDYKDPKATFAIIIAKLGADVYLSSVSTTKKQIYQQVQEQLATKANNDSLNQMASFAASGPTGTAVLIGNYTTTLLRPNRTLIVSLAFSFSILITTLLVLMRARLKTTIGHAHEFS